MEERDGMGKRRRRRGEGGAAAEAERGGRQPLSVYSVSLQGDSAAEAAAAGQWTVSTSAPNGYGAASDCWKPEVPKMTESLHDGCSVLRQCLKSL